MAENIQCPQCKRTMRLRANGYVCRRCNTFKPVPRPEGGASKGEPKPDTPPKSVYTHTFVATEEAEGALAALSYTAPLFSFLATFGAPTSKRVTPEQEPTREEVMAKISATMQKLDDKLVELRDELEFELGVAYGGMAHRRKIEKYFAEKIKPLEDSLDRLETEYAILRDTLDGVTPEEGAQRDATAMRLLDW